MAIRFQCPSCNAIRTANERLLGREIACPECGSPVQLPSLEEVEEAQRARDDARRLQQGLQQASALAAAQPAASQATLTAPSEPELSEQERIEREERELAASTASFRRPKAKEGEDMDMTPMVDVTFLLLIFFMITASFSVQKSIQRPAQKRDDPSVNTVQQEQEDNPDIVTVQVDEFNAYNVITTNWDRMAGSKQDLIVALSDAHAGSGGQQPSRLVVRAHEDCLHMAVIAALDAGREAQFESFEVSTVEQFD
ncbi:MAG: biopolymer transporter ExbD [Planctomycetota bacterium]